MLYVLSALTILAGFVAYQSRRKKRRPREQPLVGSSAIVDNYLNPIGAVLIDGELFVARSVDGDFIQARTKVTVVGVEDHLLLVARK